MYNNPLACPVCGQIDAVMKVSSLVTAGTAHHQTSSIAIAPMRMGFVAASGSSSTVSQTALSKQLAFPQHKYLLIKVLIIIFSLLFLMAAPLAFCSFTSNVAQYAGPHAGPHTLADALRATVGSLQGIILIAYIAIITACVAIRISLGKADAPRRRKALMKWDRLYYCQRDDTVFDPEFRQATVRASQMRALLEY